MRPMHKRKRGSTQRLRSLSVMVWPVSAKDVNKSRLSARVPAWILTPASCALPQAQPTTPALPCPAVSAVAGLVTTTVTAPVDMVKTHMFVNGQQYTSPLHCMAGIYKQHGVRGLFRG